MAHAPTGMRESREKEIVVPDWSHVAFVAMLEYLYTGSIPDISNEVRCLLSTYLQLQSVGARVWGLKLHACRYSPGSFG